MHRALRDTMLKQCKTEIPQKLLLQQWILFPKVDDIIKLAAFLYVMKLIYCTSVALLVYSPGNFI